MESVAEVELSTCSTAPIPKVRLRSNACLQPPNPSTLPRYLRIVNKVHEPVIIKHPGYAGQNGQDHVLRLIANDSCADGSVVGLQFDLVMTICSIITCNSSTGFLSRDREAMDVIRVGLKSADSFYDSLIYRKAHRAGRGAYLR